MDINVNFGIKGGFRMKIELTSQQEAAKVLIIEWFKTYKQTKKQTFVLAGYARHW